MEAALTAGEGVIAVVPVDRCATAQLCFYRRDGGLEALIVGRQQPGQSDVQGGGIKVPTAVGGGEAAQFRTPAALEDLGCDPFA